MKTSTRIMLAAMILWVSSILFFMATGILSHYGDVQFYFYVLVGPVAFLLLKLVLGSLIDKKKAKPESE